VLGSVVLGAVLFRSGTVGRRGFERATAWLSGRSRHARGVLRGVRYRARGGHPDEDVIDLVLADRIRSTLGPVARQLDLPHIHVMVHDHVAVLHGDVATETDREVVEGAVRKVSGVQEVESHLHIGLLPSDSRPSHGRAIVRPSEALRRLEDAARRGGATGPPDQAIRAVLSTFCARIPAGEREQVLTHLPADVRALIESTEAGTEVSPVRTLHDLLDRVAVADPALDRSRARLVTEAVLAELALLVPEERADIAAVLPSELRELWEHAYRTGTATPGA